MSRVETVELRSGTPPRHAAQQVKAPLTKRIFAHRLLSWTTLILAIAFYVLTTLYARHPSLISRIFLFGGTPSRALQVLAVLSMIANWLLGATISQSFDITRGMLIARSAGLGLMHNLALQPGTCLDGHVEIIFKWHEGGITPRAWSMAKVTSMLIIPILGIVILRDVEAIPIYYQETTHSVSRGYGVGPFNATLAPLLQPLTDSIFGTRFKDFLSDTDLVVDVSTDADRKACSNGHQNNATITCRSKFYVPGSIEQFAPQLLNDSKFYGKEDLQPVLAKDLQGYYFEFEESNSVPFDQQKDCLRQGYDLGGYQLCLKDVGVNKIAAFLTQCPRSIAANFSCLSDSTWSPNEGWGTTLSTYFRPADVAYNGLNGTILDYQFPNSSITPANITATQLLQVFDVLFNPSDPNSTYGAILAKLGIGSNKPVEPLTIWQYFQGLAELSKNDVRVRRRAMTSLQSLLAIPIYHCQAKDFSELRRLLLAQLNHTAIGQTLGIELVNLFPVANPDTDIYPALLRYTLKVGQGSLLAYIVLAGFTLLLCLIASALASIPEIGQAFRHSMGPFPLMTHLCDCETKQNGSNVSQRYFLDLEVGKRLSETANMHVKLAEKHSLKRMEQNTVGAGRLEPQNIELSSCRDCSEGNLPCPKTT